MSKGKKIVLASAIGVIIVFIGVFFTATFVRYKIINNQAIANVNTEQKVTTVFTKGKDIKLFNKTYDLIKQEGLDLIISSEKYIIRINNEDITKDILANIKIIKDDNVEDYYSVIIEGNKVSDLKINTIELFKDKEYVSLYQIENENKTLISNSLKIGEGYSDIAVGDNINNYVLAYVIPSEINISDMTINRGVPVKIDMGSEYTNGTVTIECEDKEAIEIDEKLNLTGKKVGEFELKFITSNTTKEIRLTIKPTVEKIETGVSTLSLVVDANTTVTANVIPEDSVNKEICWTSSNEEIASVDNSGKVIAKSPGTCEIIIKTTQEPIIEAKIPVEVKEKPNFSEIPQLGGNIEGATYINGILLVNKTNPIPASYSPGLNQTVWEAFIRLKEDAALEGHDIQLLSGYRSYTTQQSLYNNYVATYGQEEADTFSARPGTSEHQTGLAMDVGWIDDAYGDTPSGRWLAENCHKYGFIIRYQKGKEHITGYKYEPWHIRYLGVDIATDVYQSGLCLEEYLGVQ